MIDYKTATEYQKAEIEHQTWDQAPFEAKENQERGKGRAIYLLKILGTPRYESELRSRLYNLGAATKPLWSLVDQEMPLQTAIQIAMRAKNRDSFNLEESIKVELELYNKLPFKRQAGPGKFYRCDHASYTKKKGKKTKESPRMTSLIFWDSIKNLLGSQFAILTQEIPEVLKEEMKKEFEAEVKVLLSTLQSKIKRNKSMYSGTMPEVDRNEILNACKVLGLVPPKAKQQANQVEAKKLMKKFGKLYHPDTHPDDMKEIMTHKYNEVMNAYGAIESYNLQLCND